MTKPLALPRALACTCLVFVVCAASTAAAQGLQTGTLSGSVKDQQDLVLPGVTVTATSPAMQGARTTVTDGNGLYTMPGLPPGIYTVQYELQGMATMRREGTVVPLGGVASLDATMGLARLVAETVRVVAETPSVLASPTGQVNLTARELDSMPIGRTPFRIAELAPGLTDNVPNAGQLTISGGFAYDNVFMIDGVDVNDNIFGTANNVFIEDAIEETTVLTSGISAEYGRFSGGVINLVTKRGGNAFSGGVRLNLSNPAWNEESPLERSRGTEHVNELSKFLEGTLGGPVRRDRLWFFFATRRERSQQQSALAQVGTPVVTGIENDRYEIKLTGTPAANHTIQGSYVNNRTQDVNRAFNVALSLDNTVFITRQVPNRLFVTSYNGVVGLRTFVTAQYSERTFGFRNNGGTSTALADSPFRTRGALGVPVGLYYHAPFLSAADPEDRDNRQFAGSLAYFLTTRGTGSHNVKTGGEHFTSSRAGGNSQSATGYVFRSDYRTNAVGGLPAFDAQGRIIPRFVPNVSQVENWLSTVGAEMDITTLSFYVQDRWTASDRLSLDLGVRFEKVSSEATGDITGADAGSIAPRLGLTFDPLGDGRTLLQATYSHYSGKYVDVQYARNTQVGSPSRITYNYTGPEGEGFDFAPGMNLANYTAVVSGNFPTANVFFEDGLASPLTKEVTLSAGRELGRGHARVMYTWRKASNFLEDFVDDPSPAGKITVIRDGVNFGTFDRLEFRNSTEVFREYQGLQFMGRYTLTDNLYLNGHYTAQLKNHGNFEGESANSPASPSDLGDYPEVLSATRNFPYGRLNDFQRHKVRLWAVYNQSLGRAGSVDIAPLWKYNSALTYSLMATAVPLSALQSARNTALGYARLFGGGVQTLYFDERGSEEFAGYGVVDLAVSYQVPVWRTLRPWLKFELFNVLNNDTLIAWTTTVTPDANSPLDANGLRTGYITAANFGTARNNADYPRPLPGIDGGRTLQLAFGLRF